MDALGEKKTLVISLENLRQRITALLLLPFFTAGSVVYWSQPSIKPQASAASFQMGPSEQVSHEAPSLSSHVRRGFTINVLGKKGPARHLLLHSESEALIRTLIAELNESISLPADIEVFLKNCDYPDVYYDDDERSMTICYQWIDDMELILQPRLRDKAKVRAAIGPLVVAVVLHETGHALIHLLKIPVTGREEDDADEFSTLVLMNQKDGPRKALEVARVYKVLSDNSRGAPPIYWDEHSSDGQRYYDTLCMIYGRDPDQNAKLISSKWLPEDRADLCEQDYRRIESSWKLLLKPYVKDSFWQAQ